MTGPNGSLVLEHTRVFDGPTEQVFRSFTDPTELAKWWGPHGFTTPEIQIDPRVGGSYRFTMQPPEGEAFHLSGGFLEIQGPSKIRFTFRWDEPVPDDRETVATVSLESLGEKTTVKLTHGDFATEERLELHRSGWLDSLDKLEAVLKAQGA